MPTSDDKRRSPQQPGYLLGLALAVAGLALGLVSLMPVPWFVRLASTPFLTITGLVVTSVLSDRFERVTGDLFAPGRLRWILVATASLSAALTVVLAWIPPHGQSEPPALGLSIRVKALPEGQQSIAVDTRPGERLRWTLKTTNLGKGLLTHVVTRDVMPPHLRLDPGSVEFFDAAGNTILKDRPLFGGGYDMGAYSPGGEAVITFTTTVLDDFPECEVTVRSLARARARESSEENRAFADAHIFKQGVPGCMPAS